MPERAQLTIFGEGEIEVSLVVDYLADFLVSYNSLVAFHSITNPRRIEQYSDLFYFRRRGSSGAYASLTDLLAVPQNEKQLSALVPLSERIVLSRVQLSSPGFWSFLGSLNPLEVTRNYLVDRHERRKDRDYRERAEERRLALENLSLENKIIKERIDILKDLGVTDREIVPLLNELVYKPIAKLGQYQDKGLIGGATIDRSSPDDGRDRLASR